MNLYNLKNIAATILGVNPTQFTANGVDMFLNAANNARLYAEKRHNWEYTRVRAWIFINGVVGTPLSQAHIDDTSGEGVTVSGTLNPNVTGNYVRIGNWGIRPLYALFNWPSPIVAYLFYCGQFNSYIISQTLADSGQVDYWIPSPIQPFPLGTYTPQGSVTGTATVAVTQFANWAGIKEITYILRTCLNGMLVPMDFTRDDIPVERDRTTRELTDNYWPWNRYPSDADILNVRGNASIVQRRQSLFIYPSPTSIFEQPPIKCLLGAFAWLAPYTSVGLVGDPDQDFTLTQGASYMQWKIIEELNYIFKTFVNRTEGNISSKEIKDNWQAAFQEFLDWDNYLIDSNVTRSR